MGSATGEKIHCLHCKAEFVRKQQVEIYFEGKGNLRINTGGGAFIGGNLNVGGDFIGGDKITGDKVTIIRTTKKNHW